MKQNQNPSPDKKQVSIFQGNSLTPNYHLPMWYSSFSTETTFCKALVNCNYLSYEQMVHAAQRFHLGRSRDGGVIFWQLDEHGVTRDGKIMFYRDDCHRDKSPGKHPTWVSARLKAWSGYNGELNVQRCIFGLHQLPLAYLRHKPVAVLESEKTAVIMSQRRPEYLWMASGGLSMLQPHLLKPLRGQKVIHFPDTDPDGKTFQRWSEVAAEAQKEFIYPIYVSRLLEDHATPEQKQQKIDIVDFICH